MIFLTFAFFCLYWLSVYAQSGHVQYAEYVLGIAAVAAVAGLIVAQFDRKEDK